MLDSIEKWKRICLDKSYSTTRLLKKVKLKSFLLLPEGENRQGEGGLRTQDYFKMSYDDKPLISIITVVYNGEEFLEETIQSVINQSYDNVEYIIIDGGSTDGTLDIIQKYEDKIDYWVSEKDNGIYDAMNKGIIVSNGDFINFMNAGDTFVNEKVIDNICVDVENIDLVYGAIVLKDQDKNDIVSVYPKKFTKFNLIVFGTATLCHQAMFINKRVVVLYSLEYGLKGELNWYFDIQRRLVTYKIVPIPIANYLLGGLSSADDILAIKEVIKVMFVQNNILGILSIPFIVYNFFRKKLS